MPLYIVSTPIGNLSDITLRSLEILRNADIILCEDTRQSLKLLNSYEIKPDKLISFYSQIEEKKINQIILTLKENKEINIVLITDNGISTI
ncbi:MAG TPA: SAM-dependent methyltransferase, partial [Exilispira sp.]|nr:SAM-dependent methyltransferase [Exilispira sp.]